MSAYVTSQILVSAGVLARSEQRYVLGLLDDLGSSQSLPVGNGQSRGTPRSSCDSHTIYDD